MTERTRHIGFWLEDALSKGLWMATSPEPHLRLEDQVIPCSDLKVSYTDDNFSWVEAVIRESDVAALKLLGIRV